MKQWIGIVAALLIETQANAQPDGNSARGYYPSCLAADIVQGKHPAADSEETAKQLKQAAICFGAVTAIMNLEPFFKPEFAMCPPQTAKYRFLRWSWPLRPTSKTIRTSFTTISINLRPPL